MILEYGGLLVELPDACPVCGDQLHEDMYAHAETDEEVSCPTCSVELVVYEA